MRFWEWLRRKIERRKSYIVVRMPLAGRNAFVERCTDDNMTARFGRPDIYVADLERMGER